MLSLDGQEKCKRSLTNDEGYRNFPYADIFGNITIGIGYNLTARGLSNGWIDNQFEQDAEFFYNQLNHDFPWYAKLNEDRQIILINMAFMGYKKLLGFTDMLNALAKEDYAEAAKQMLASEWATQVKDRATRLAAAMQSGVYDV